MSVDKWPPLSISNKSVLWNLISKSMTYLWTYLTTFLSQLWSIRNLYLSMEEFLLNWLQLPTFKNIPDFQSHLWEGLCVTYFGQTQSKTSQDSNLINTKPTNKEAVLSFLVKKLFKIFLKRTIWLVLSEPMRFS